MKDKQTHSSGEPVDSLSFKTLFVYSLPAVPTAMLLSPIGVILPAFYAKYTEVGLAGVGTALLVGRLFDAFSDPMVGILSDRTRGRFGRRKPWMAAGALIAVLSVWFLFQPPVTAKLPYYLFAMIGLFIGYTMLDIPHRSWGVELSRDYKQRTKISTFVGFAGTMGFVLFLGVPQLPIFKTADITPDTLQVMKWTIIGLMPLVFVGLFLVPAGKELSVRRLNFRLQAKAIFRNRPFGVFLAALMTGGIGNGVHLALIYIFLDTYLQIPQVILISTLSYVLAQLAGLPITLKVMGKLGKHKTWAVSATLYALFHFAVIFLPPGQASFYPFLALTILSGLATSAWMVAPMAVLGDIVDYDTLKTGADRAGNYFALMTLVMKANMAIGSALGFFLLAAIGFDVHGDNSKHITTLFLIIFVALPQIFGLLSAGFIAFFPIDQRRHDIIRRRILRRKSGTVRQDITQLS